MRVPMAESTRMFQSTPTTEIAGDTTEQLPGLQLAVFQSTPTTEIAGDGLACRTR